MAGGSSYESLVSFERDGKTIRVRDEIEGQSMVIDVTGEFDVQPALTDAFLFPVDEAVSVTTSRLRISSPYGHASAWDATGEHVGYFYDGRLELPTGTYYLNVAGSVLLYFQASNVGVTTVSHGTGTADSMLEIVLDSPSPIRIGARSLHTRPEATITVPDEPKALLEAIPYLSSSIKEFSSERSWPTLRGHPPAIERGDRLAIPQRLTKPDTGVTIAVPVEYAALYRVAPLAFYLGADLIEGDRPTLHLKNGYAEPLETSTYSLEERVDGLLARCFLLDSLVRTDGYMPSERVDYDEIAGTLSFYPPNLYGESLSSQLLEYLEVAETVLEPHYPCWPMTAVLRPEYSDVELLPYLLHELARIHVRSSLESVGGEAAEPQPPPGSSLVSACTHERPPAGFCLQRTNAYQNVSNHDRPVPGDACIAIITGDSDRMDHFRTNRDMLEAGEYGGEVALIERPTRRELEGVLRSNFDFLFCELPVTKDGFACADGPLDLTGVDEIDSTAVALCGDAALDATKTFVSRGNVVGLALDGVVSLEQLTKFLELVLHGFTLVDCARFADFARETRYRLCGITSFTVVKSAGEVPVLIGVESVERTTCDASIWTFPTDIIRLGTEVNLDFFDGSFSGFADEHLADGVTLNGSVARTSRPIHTSDVVALVESDYVIRLNGQLVREGDEPTEELVRESARRSIDEVQ